MLALTPLLFCLCTWYAVESASDKKFDTKNDRNVTTLGHPRTCKDLFQRGNTFEGYYVVYQDESTPNKPSIQYCSKDDGMFAQSIDKATSKNCLDLLQNGMSNSGVNIIYPYADTPNDPVLVLCDQETDGGGWTVIQKRYDGSEEFYRSYEFYQMGFGNPNEEHYIGNDIIAALTGQSVNELRVDLGNWQGEKAYAHYQFFHVDARHNYMLQMSLYDGTAGDPVVDTSDTSVGQGFSTYDMDHDSGSLNCAESYHGAWWYAGCGCWANLNGRYYSNGDVGNNDDSMRWDTFGGHSSSLKSSKMMVRPYSCVNN